MPTVKRIRDKLRKYKYGGGRDKIKLSANKKDLLKQFDNPLIHLKPPPDKKKYIKKKKKKKPATKFVKKKKKGAPLPKGLIQEPI